MIMTDLIAKKRDGSRLSAEEIEFMIRGCTSGDIPDYQMSAMLMAIVLKGMDAQETLDLTMSMLRSGKTMDLSSVEGVKVDKHSTGGVGDKTSLVLCPMLAAQGAKVAKISGRGLGHTGGTIDKLECFPGFSTAIDDERFIQNVNEHGIALIGQTAELVPADKKLYALRDVTATVPSIPLIVSSIMSKKLASGADVIALDVKAGRGSFMTTVERAVTLARELTRVGRLAGKKTLAIISDMDEPLGNAVGNSLEVKEAIRVLRGEEEGELLELCLTLGSNMLVQAGLAESCAEAEEKLMSGIRDGSALGKLAELVEAQGGDKNAVYDTSLLPDAEYKLDVPSECAGWVKKISAQEVGLVSMHLGGGRITKESEIDLAVGLMLNKKVGDRVEKGDSLGTVHASDPEKGLEAVKLFRDCFEFSAEPVPKPELIKEIIV